MTELFILTLSFRLRSAVKSLPIGSRLVGTFKMLWAGWPTLLPFSNVAAPLFALFEGWEPMFSGHRNLLRLLLLFFNDAATSPLLRRWVPALYHFQLLSPTGATRLGSPPQAVSRNSGAGSPPLQIYRRRICDYARAFPPADPRAGAGQSLDRDAGAKATLRAASAHTMAQAEF